MAGSRLVLPSQQPVQSTGLPYPGGQLFFYVSDTTTPANTYQDAALVTPNANPVILDSAGDAGNVFLDQSIVYKIVLLDATGDLIWTFDPVYPFAPSTIQGVAYAGTTTGSANTQYLSGLPAPYNGQAITFTAGYENTASTTLNTGNGNVFIYQQGPAGPALLAGKELQVGTTYASVFIAALNDDKGGWQILGAVSPTGIGANAALLPFYEATSVQSAYAAIQGYIPPPSGRLTLTAGVPVLNSAVNAATAVLFTPYVGDQVPIWNTQEATWSISAFAELTCTLSDATLSPAAAAANSLYDLFVWSNSGTLVLSRGPAWTSATARSLALARTNGVLANSTAITNGPGANIGVYVGTIATDSTGGTVTFNPTPAPASAGPAGGAWIGLWNQYNRLPVVASTQDNKSGGWTYASSAWRAADNSNNNRVTYVNGTKEDYSWANYTCSVSDTTTGGTGVAVDTTTAPGTQAWAVGPYGSTQTATLWISPLLGQHFIQAVESSVSGSAVYSSLGGAAALVAELKF